MDSKRATIILLSGALGGALNAGLCYMKWPVPVEESNVTFHWHVIPAGLVHGGVLALLPILIAGWAARRHCWVRWLAIPVVGWCGGYLSWIPLDMSAFGSSFPEALIWPVRALDTALSVVLSPLLYFGLVSSLLYGSLIWSKQSLRVWPAMAAASCAGVLGSLWWWASWGPWYFSPLHGSIWGGLVGLALSWSEQVRIRRTYRVVHAVANAGWWAIGAAVASA